MHLSGPRSKPARGLHTKNHRNAWDEAAELEVWRGGEKLDPGVNYFVLMFDQMGLPTAFSCEGHPDGFYVTFSASYKQALKIRAVGYFGVEIEGEQYWSLRRHTSFKDAEAERIDAMRWAVEAWERRLGPLDFGAVDLVRD